jgi:hypothetical protein
LMSLHNKAIMGKLTNGENIFHQFREEYRSSNHR